MTTVSRNSLFRQKAGAAACTAAEDGYYHWDQNLETSSILSPNFFSWGKITHLRRSRTKAVIIGVYSQKFFSGFSSTYSRSRFSLSFFSYVQLAQAPNTTTEPQMVMTMSRMTITLEEYLITFMTVCSVLLIFPSRSAHHLYAFAPPLITVIMSHREQTLFWNMMFHYFHSQNDTRRMLPATKSQWAAPLGQRKSLKIENTNYWVSGVSKAIKWMFLLSSKDPPGFRELRTQICERNNLTSLTRISVELKWLSNDFWLWVVSCED